MFYEEENKKEPECPLCQVSGETLKRLKRPPKAKSSPIKKGMVQKFLGLITSIGGALSGGLGLAGLFGWCCLPLVAGVLGLFGISAGFLMAYNKTFIGIGIFLMGIAVIIFARIYLKGR